MEALVDHVKTLAKSCNAKTRREILDQLQSLCHSIESPDDTVQRISFLNLQLAGLRIGADLKLFNILSESSSPLTIDQISKNTKENAVLLGIHRTLEHSYTLYQVNVLYRSYFAVSCLSCVPSRR
jgi:demethylsterigmatocystin 6-O-methyltransferase